MDDRPRDIDYAAKAVRAAMEEKFFPMGARPDLEVTANERTITLSDGVNRLEGTRDQLLATIRRADSYTDVWQSLVSENR